MRSFAWLPLVLLLASCGDEAAPPAAPDVQVPRVAAIWEGKLPPGPHAKITLVADGEGRFNDTLFAKPGDDGRASEASLATLRRQFIELTSAEEHRSSDGTSSIPAVITADARIPWWRVQHVLNLCAHPSVQMYRLLFQVRREGD